MNRRDRLIRGAFRERFVVTMRSGASFDALLVDVDDNTVTFADAFALEGQQRIKVDGQLYLPRLGIDYMQKPEVRG